jgi:glycosyltransferase involved in cell wall biosynthesis
MITFIVPAHNEERLISRTLHALHTASRSVNEPYEIIVVDDASTDATAAIAMRHGARVVPVQHRQIAAARNAGARQAQGDLIVFVDADTDISGGVVSAALDAMRAGAVGGSARARFDGRVPLYGQVLLWVWLRLQRIWHLANGCFIFCSREALQAVGGFDESLYVAEDVALSMRLGRLGRFVILREIVVTSGRTVRSHSGFEMLRMLTAFMLPGTFSTRHGYWYSQRREDPESNV